MPDPPFGGSREQDRLPQPGAWSVDVRPAHQGPPAESLVVVTGAGGPHAQRNSASPDRPWTVGRATDADFVVPGDQVSRRHLVLEHDQYGWLVRDVSSTGSWHEGTRIEPAGLRVPPGSTMRLNLGEHTGPLVVLERPPAAVVNPYVPAGASPIAKATTKPRHRFRRIAIVLVVLVLLLAIADRVAAHIASTTAMSKIVQQSEGLVRRPSVSFGGFPFLTQVAFGKYTDIGVEIHDITPPGSLRIETIRGHLQGAHVPLSTVINGKVSKVPVDHVAATVAVRFADLNPFLAKQPGHLRLTGHNGAIQVSGTFVEAGQRIKVSGAARLEAQDGGLVVTPTSVHLAGGGDLGDLLGDASDVLGDVASVFPSVPVPLPDLPFNLRLTSVHSDDTEVVASATADHVVLDPGAT